MEAVRRSIRSFEDKRYAVMKQRNIIGQVCDTPKSYDNVMNVGLRKVTFKWQRGNKIGMYCTPYSLYSALLLVRASTELVSPLNDTLSSIYRAFLQSPQ